MKIINFQNISLKLCQTLILSMALLSSNVMAQLTAPASTILAREPGGASISAADVMSELRRAPPAERQAFLSKPETVQQLASNLLVRRVLAAEAERDGLGTDPVISATITITRDRVLSDTQLAKLDAQNTPVEGAIEAYARNVYNANLNKFERPAETRARHILLATGPDALQNAKELLARLRAGASFEDLARANSIDSGSAARGGDLGFFGAGKMVQPFEDALNRLSKPGDLSEPVESQFGLHIIRLEERREKSVQSYDEVRTKLLGDARSAMLNESRIQKVLSLTKNFVFEAKAIEALGNPATQ